MASIMSFVPYALTRPFLFGLDAERAHELTLDAIARLQGTPLQHLWAQPRIDDPVSLAGLRFPNRIETKQKRAGERIRHERHSESCV